LSVEEEVRATGDGFLPGLRLAAIARRYDDNGKETV
jgi:hypothetical protein